MVTSDAIRLGVDVGGTFTDVVLLVDGAITTAKVPTTADQSEGVLEGITLACERAGVDPDDVEQFRHAMTVGTNALLEGTGAKTALLTTSGFEDVLEIGRQDRPALYDLSASGPDPLVPGDRRYGISERVTPEGVESVPNQSELQEVLEAIDDDVESIALCLLHAYATPDNERRVASVLRQRTDALVVPSHETLPEFREYERTATTAADASVTPIIASYLERLADRARDRGLPELHVMQSNGGITETSILSKHAVTTVLSGPAAGVVGASLFEKRDASYEGIITFDMGGTSSDVGLVRDGEIERTTSGDVGGHPVHVPMVDVETVGAGGGSIAWVDAGGALRVGPRSAGAEPGPACYGRGGTDPTVTDANLVLGYLGQQLGGELSLDSSTARTVLADLSAAATLENEVEAARGVCRVANERMARAIRAVTVERGHDVRNFALVAFGGAGPMHAAFLAESLGIDTIRVPRANGVLSALGLLAADEHHDASRTYRQQFANTDPGEIGACYADLTDQALAAVSDPDRASIRKRADVRYTGQSYELTVDVPGTFDPESVETRFHALHDRIRGYRRDDEAVELVNLRVTATVPSSTPNISHEGNKTEPGTVRDAYFDGEFVRTPVYDRDTLPAGATFDGPAIFEGGESTVVVPPGWHASVDTRGTLDLAVVR